MMASLHAGMPGLIRGQIIGDGPERTNLERLADSLQLLSDVVEFTGSAADMAHIYQAADIVVLCSDWEGSPNVLLEALACGLPVIASDVGGVSEIVKHHENGYLVPPRDIRQFAEYARTLALSSDLRSDMGHAGRSLAMRNHSPEMLSSTFEQLFRKALA
jgi:glycosyltransferase involved in cell wall biosynthesis